MSCSAEYAPQLHLLGFRLTSQRLAILHVLRRARGHLSPMQVYSRARRAAPGLTAPTVYRTLEFLANNGLAWPTSTGRGHLAYEIAQNNHHHLICRSCGGEIVLKPARLKDFYQELESTSGYILGDNHATFFGLCPKCQTSGLRKADPE
jgi:Fur family ferric uptake transcriptional regulator